MPFYSAQKFTDGLLQPFQSAAHRLVFISPDQFQRAYELQLRYQDKPDISFVDFTSMIVMQDLGLSEVFTGDAHFEHVGLGFRTLP